MTELNEKVVFVGGSALPFLVPAAVAATIRVTQDVDCVIQAATWIEYQRVEKRLRELGFQVCNDEGAPICRWIIDGIRVDVMPAREEILGFLNRWYDELFAAPLNVQVDPVLSIKVADYATFLATKFEAFAARGQGDYMASSDFEDAVTVIAYCSDIENLVFDASEPVRLFLIDWSKKLLELDNLSDIVSGCLLPDAVSQQAVPVVIEKLRRIAGHRQDL
jgi:predicted nucleotidyltransferase